MKARQSSPWQLAVRLLSADGPASHTRPHHSTIPAAPNQLIKTN